MAYRRYWRFRGGKWYGGIATADVVGCNLRCGVCWAWRFAFRSDAGRLLAPSEVAERLAEIARRNGYKYARISGGEPTIAPRHLLAALEEVPRDLTFILETNGILIDDAYARRLAGFPNLAVRVSIKGASPEEFERITLADGRYFHRQLDAIRALVDAGFRPCEEVYPAAMLGLSPEGAEGRLAAELAKIDVELAQCIDDSVPPRGGADEGEAAEAREGVEGIPPALAHRYPYGAGEVAGQADAYAEEEASHDDAGHEERLDPEVRRYSRDQVRGVEQYSAEPYGKSETHEQEAVLEGHDPHQRIRIAEIPELQRYGQRGAGQNAQRKRGQLAQHAVVIEAEPQYYQRNHKRDG